MSWPIPAVLGSPAGLRSKGLTTYFGPDICESNIIANSQSFTNLPRLTQSGSPSLRSETHGLTPQVEPQEDLCGALRGKCLGRGEGTFLLAVENASMGLPHGHGGVGRSVLPEDFSSKTRAFGRADPSMWLSWHQRRTHPGRWTCLIRFLFAVQAQKTTSFDTWHRSS